MTRSFWGGDLSSTAPTAERQHRHDGSTLMGTASLHCTTRTLKPDFPAFVRMLRDAHPDLLRDAATRSVASAWEDIPSAHFRPAHIDQAVRALEVTATARERGAVRAAPRLIDGKDYPREEEIVDDLLRGVLE